MSTPPKPSKPYSEAYLPEVVEMQGKFFERLQDEPTPIDSSDMIAAYLNSDTRRQLDEGHAYYLTLNADDLKRVFLEESHYEPKSGEPLRGFLPNWIGQFYAYAQWKLGVSSRELVRRIPVRALCVAYPGLHDLALPLAVDKMTNSLPDPRSLIPDPSSRKGSALLVVLGMLSFMVMSAVAFSVYMRQNRLPSSFLTQQASTALITKAALAEAMHELDHALGDDLYPNDYSPNTGWLFDVPQPKKYMCCGNGKTEFYNAWRNRLYTGDAQVAESEEGCDPETTVATMPLEGLAYLPPPLVNTVRHWMRHSSSARWKRMAYDAGRFAFTAINVSDYLDINRLRAGIMRDSSPQNRITLSYRFENTGHTGWGPFQPAAFDQAISNLCLGAYGRLVSMADYNLAIANGALAGASYESPFCKYIKTQPTNIRPFYGGDEPAVIRQQTFVTDSWHPSTSTNSNVIALSDFVDEDFFQGSSGPIVGNLDELQKTARPDTPYECVQRHLSLATLGALYDYLDADSVPVSLAIPSAERAPMLTGLQVDVRELKPKFVRVQGQETTPYNNNPNQKAIAQQWNFDGLEGGGTVQITGSAVFPFKRTSGKAALTYTVEVVVKAFLAEVGAFSKMRIAGDLRPTAAEWENPEQDWANKGYFTMCGSKQLSVNNNPQNASEAVAGLDFNMTLRPQVTNRPQPLYAYLEVQEKQEGVGGTWVDKPELFADNTAAMTRPFPYLTEAGAVTPVPQTHVLAGKGGTELQLVCLAWARIKDSNGAVVDLFPARLDDDMNMNGINHGTKLLAGNSAIAASLCGPEYGVVPVGSGAVVKLEDTAFPVSGTQATVAPAVGGLALYCNDPRYNFAPEDWYQVSVEGGVRATDWLSRVQAAKGDDDIFFAVSDAGYLQSVGELQNLPYTGEFGRNGGNFNPVKGQYYNQGKYDGVMRTQVGELASVRDGNFAWQSYWAFDPAPHRTVADEQLYLYEDLKNAAGTKSLVDSVGGASVSRYTPNLDLFMAALANTPYDWAVADRYFGETVGGNAQDNIQKYCFNGHSGSEAPLDWDDLKEIAQKMQTHFRAGDPYDEWTDWGSANFFGLLGPNDGIHDIDRKFLYSYWRNCFEDNQQLYLMFVRAEPLMMMGGGDQNHTPAQLGARAVALVWRDPARHPQASASSGNGTVPVDQPSHKMRVLFYHQFD